MSSYRMSILAIDEGEKYLNLIPPETMASIKAQEEHPVFKVYVLAQEGLSRPYSVDPETGRKTVEKIKWPAAIIKSFKDLLFRGLKFFWGHNDGATELQREVVGKVVGWSEEKINGKLSSVVVAHILPGMQHLAAEGDVVSMEVSAIVDKVTKTVDKLLEITGIAMGSSEDWSPAVPGARELVTIQAQEVEEPKKPMTYEELKSHIRTLHVKPSQLFDPEDFLGRRMTDKAGHVWYEGGDRAFRPIIEEWEERVKKAGEASAGEVAEKDKELNEQKRKLAKYEAEPKIEEWAKELGLSESALALARTEFSRFTPDEDVEKSARSFLSEIKKRDEVLQKIYIKPEAKKNGKGSSAPLNPPADELLKDPVEAMLPD